MPSKKIESKIKESKKKPITEQGTEPITELETEPITEQRTEPITEQETEPITEQVTEPITELGTKAKKKYEKYKLRENKKVQSKLSPEELYKSLNEQRTKLVENWVNNLIEVVVPMIQEAINDNRKGPYCTINVKDGVIGQAFGRSVDLTRQLNQDFIKDGKKTTYHRNFINLLSEKTNTALVNTRVFVTIKPLQESSGDFTITWMKYQQKARVYSSDGKLLNFF